MKQRPREVDNAHRCLGSCVRISRGGRSEMVLLSAADLLLVSELRERQ